MRENDTIHARRVWQGGEGRASWKVIAELHQIGLQAPYFSVTFHSIDMGGCCHEECAKLAPECAPFIKWHLTSPKGPMHYAANALYWAGLESYRDGNGILAFRRSPWCDKAPSPGSSNPPNWDHFASTIVLGGVPGDPTIEELRAKWDAIASPGADVYAFITGRLERLRAAFAHAMHTCFEDQPAGVLAAFEYDEDAARAAAGEVTR